MPLVRSRWEVRRMRFHFTVRFYVVLAIWTLVFAAIVAGYRFLGW